MKETNMKHLGSIIFIIATAVLCIGVVVNLGVNPKPSIGSTGAMAMNSYYLLATAIYVASVAAQLIWGRKTA